MLNVHPLCDSLHILTGDESIVFLEVLVLLFKKLLDQVVSSGALAITHLSKDHE